MNRVILAILKDVFSVNEEREIIKIRYVLLNLATKRLSESLRIAGKADAVK